jgi:phosphoribosyl-ATP pyrophosphohydrolase
MKVTVNNYIELANRTNNPDYRKIVPRLEGDFEELRATCVEAVEVLNKLDKIKKATYYGKGFDESKLKDGEPLVIEERHKSNIDVLHGIIGIATEASELLEAFLNSDRTGEDFDTVNLVEEVSDVMWYQAIILARAGVSFEHAMQVNIDKLRKRFPDGFTEAKANNRDLELERRALEQGFGSVETITTSHNFVD